MDQRIAEVVCMSTLSPGVSLQIEKEAATAMYIESVHAFLVFCSTSRDVPRRAASPDRVSLCRGPVDSVSWVVQGFAGGSSPR